MWEHTEQRVQTYVEQPTLVILPVPREAFPSHDVGDREGGRWKSGRSTKQSGYTVDTLQLLQLQNGPVWPLIYSLQLSSLLNPKSLCCLQWLESVKNRNIQHLRIIYDNHKSVLGFWPCSGICLVLLYNMWALSFRCFGPHRLTYYILISMK